MFNKKKKRLGFVIITLIIISLVSCNSSDGTLEDSIEIEKSLEKTNEVKNESQKLNDNIIDSKDNSETLIETQISDLFYNIYYEIVNDNKFKSKKEVKKFLDSSIYNVEASNFLDGYMVTYDERPEDYVLIMFSDSDDKAYHQILESVSYYDGDKNIEVSWKNYSLKKEQGFDTYSTHIIGEKSNVVNNLSEQIDFLNTAVNIVSEKEKKRRVEKPIQLELKLDYEIKDGKIISYVETNLPDGISGIITVTNDNIGYMGQSSIDINGGKGKTESFSQKGEKLLPGKYKMEITFPLANVLDDDIYIQVGKDYRNYEGKEIIMDEMGITINKTIDVVIK